MHLRLKFSFFVCFAIFPIFCVLFQLHLSQVVVVAAVAVAAASLFVQRVCGRVCRALARPKFIFNFSRKNNILFAFAFRNRIIYMLNKYKVQAINSVGLCYLSIKNGSKYEFIAY